MKITSKEMLIKHIEDHKGKNVPLFAAYNIGLGSFVRDETIKSHHKIEIKHVVHNDDSISDHEFIHLDGQFRHSLHDRHVSGEKQTYNDNWWFTNHEEAENYIKHK